MSQSSRPVRLVVTPATSAAIDAAMVEAAYLAKQKVTKAELTDAAIRVGLAHLAETAALIANSDYAPEGEVTPDE